MPIRFPTKIELVINLKSGEHTQVLQFENEPPGSRALAGALRPPNAGSFQGSEVSWLTDT
jgi:hypothetical protein